MRTKRWRRLARGLAAVSVLCLSHPALADDGREREARKACLEGDYSKGVAILAELFLKTKAPNYVFNQGRCYQQNNRFEEAIERFREYLRVDTQASAEEQELTRRHMASCQERLDAERARAAATTAPAVAPEKPGAGLRWAGEVAWIAGGSALLAGVLLNLKANSVAKEIEPPNTYVRSTEDRRATYETLSWVGYGVGAAGLVTGTVLYVLGWRAGKAAPTVTWLPGGVGMVMKGTY